MIDRTTTLIMAVVVTTAFVSYRNANNDTPIPVAAQPDEAANRGTQRNPLAIVEPAKPSFNQSDAAEQQPQSIEPDTALPTITEFTEFTELDFYPSSIARNPWSNEEKNNLRTLIEARPELVQALLFEFKTATDPERLGRLASIFSGLDHPDLIPLAQEMIYEAQPHTQEAAFTILKNSPNPAALDVVIELLASETDPNRLESVLDIAASLAPIDSQQRALLTGQLLTHTTHDDPVVRRESYRTLAQINDDGSQNTQLLQGLYDTDNKVRQTIAASFVDNAVRDNEVTDRLLSLAENSQEWAVTRQKALQALHRMELSPTEESRVDAATLLLNERN